MKKYSIENYNKHVCLKVNGLMLLISLYLLKPFIIAAATIVYRGEGIELRAIFYPDKMIISFEAAAAIPLLFLIYAWIKKNHHSTQMIKTIWNNGRQLIMITAFLQLCAVSTPLWPGKEINMTNSSWGQLVVFLLILVVTPFSGYMKDCFADFPEQHDKKTT